MTDVEHVPPFRDLPRESLMLRKNHLLREISPGLRPPSRHQLRRPLFVVVALAAAAAVMTPAFALSSTVRHLFGLGADADLPITNKWEATLTSNIDANAPAGSVITVTFKVDAGTDATVGAQGIFVRLLSRTGAPPTFAYAIGVDGDYQANIRVPDGGIGDIQTGIYGWTNGPSPPKGASGIPAPNTPAPDLSPANPAPNLFPITNDPFTR
jgi:hypothetical protein